MSQPQNRDTRSRSVSAMQLSDLCLSLSGKQSHSISTTKQLVALMRVDVAEAKGDWNIIGDSTLQH